MNNNTLHLKVKQRLNKLDSQDYDNIQCWQVIEAYNKAAMAWVRRQIQGINALQVGDEETTTKIDDLQVLLKTEILELEDKGMYFESQPLPPDYLGFKRIDAKASRECCKNSVILRIYPVEEVNVPILYEDALTEPSFIWGETFCTIVGNRIRIYKKDDWEIKDPILMYYKQPRFIQIENCVDPYTGLVSTGNVESEFKIDITELIIDDAVSILSDDIESQMQSQLSRERSQKNT